MPKPIVIRRLLTARGVFEPFVRFDVREGWVCVPRDGWVGIGFDGVLVVAARTEFIRPPYPIGAPIPFFLELARELAGGGVEVRVVTPRAAHDADRAAVENWLGEHGLPGLRVTDRVDEDLFRWLDPAAVGVVADEGRFQVRPVSIDEEESGGGAARNGDGAENGGVPATPEERRRRRWSNWPTPDPGGRGVPRGER